MLYKKNLKIENGKNAYQNILPKNSYQQKLNPRLTYLTFDIPTLFDNNINAWVAKQFELDLNQMLKGGVAQLVRAQDS